MSDLSTSSFSAMLKAVVASKPGIGEDVVPLVPERSSRALYVHQGEVAVVAADGSFSFVGSDDATTCIILLARNADRSRILVAHIDSLDRCSNLTDILEDLGQGGDGVDVWLCGAMVLPMDEAGGDDDEEEEEEAESAMLLIAIMTELEAASSAGNECRVQLLHVLQRNTHVDESGVQRPRIMGFGFAVQPDGVSAVVPMKFPIETRGPDFLLRLLPCLLSSQTALKPITRMHGQECFVVLPAFSAPDVSVSALRDLLALGDHDLLEATSTSPACEPPHYAQTYRAALAYAVEHLDEKGCLGIDAERVYRLIGPSDWQLVSDLPTPL